MDFTFVILGATGDLTRRKLIPAIYKLIEDKKISKVAIIGAALPDTDAQTILKEAKKFVKRPSKAVWNKIEKAFHYHKLDFYDEDGYKAFRDTIKFVETKNRINGGRIFYMATMPEHFSIITENLSRSKIVKKSEKSKTRIVYEKPFGYDLKSSQTINRNITKVFDESQIYRIDHYLGKELIGDIALVRFTNRIFEPLWNNEHIDSIQITLSETLGMEGRGLFYDKTGAINDMLQSHILQIMALVSMEAPAKLSGKDIREAKAQVLKKIRVVDSIVGQYDGYTQEKGVDPKSKTETFVAAKLMIDNKRWKGVPFYVKTGKCLDEKSHKVYIRFKMAKCRLETCPSEPNNLTIDANEGFYLEVNSKVPGKYEVAPVRMDFCHTCLFGMNTPEAYENLLVDIMRGDQSVFLRHDEIELSWKVVEELKGKQHKLQKYKKGSGGPDIKKICNIGWR